MNKDEMKQLALDFISSLNDDGDRCTEIYGTEKELKAPIVIEFLKYLGIEL